MNRYQQRRHRGDQFGGDPARSGFGHFGPEGQWEKHGGQIAGQIRGRIAGGGSTGTTSTGTTSTGLQAAAPDMTPTDLTPMQ